MVAHCYALTTEDLEEIDSLLEEAFLVTFCMEQKGDRIQITVTFFTAR